MSNYQLFQNDLPDKVLKSFKGDISIDTETLGLNIKRDRLCLIQLRNETNKKVYLIKFDEDLSPKFSKNIKFLLENKSLTKIFHFARADLLFLKKFLNVNVENIDCTKVMSKIARSYSDKHGLKDLIKEFIGIDVSKQLQSSDFGGDLSDKQLKYCAQDVVYLHKIYESLNNILIREKRYELYNKTIKFINTRVELDLASFDADIWSH